MKDHKLLIAGFILLLLTIFVAVFIWLWTSNRKNTDPLPIMAGESESASDMNGNELSDTANSVLNIRAEETLQVPLDDIIISFESRYPHVQVLASYIPYKVLLASPSNDSDFAADTDIIITNDNNLSTKNLLPLQAELQQSKSIDDQNQESTDINKAIDNTQDKKLHTSKPFNYALKNEQALEGAILTDNPTAINFRNFLLSSTGQDILKKYDYENISGYKNSVNDLFEPTSQAKTASGNHAVDVTEALSNGE